MILALVLLLTRPYFPVEIAKLPGFAHTHVEITGVVELVKREEDDDVHMRVGDGKGAHVVCEIIPTLQPENRFTVPKVGDRVKIRGISRVDPRHKWQELHPVEVLTIVKAKQ
jgi:hypothetical protein